ncbi:MAG: hypothetical protein L0241_26025 [Planctomycetia bacterium]|nr:hypothetical protein [Planctomycetia bacterium]
MRPLRSIASPISDRSAGNKFIAAWSRDGKKWTEFDARKVDWDKKVKVGVVAENIFQVPVEVGFDQYSLTQPKK